MSPEQQRIAIAEACGWKRCRIPTQSKSDPEPRGWARGNESGWKARSITPDYPNDLNAMHEAEKVLKLQPSRWKHYVSLIHAMADRGVTASAADKSRLFLRAIGRWIE